MNKEIQNRFIKERKKHSQTIKEQNRLPKNERSQKLIQSSKTTVEVLTRWLNQDV